MTRNRRALDLVRQLGQAEAQLRGQEFLAPLLRWGRARLRLQGLVYEFTVPNVRPGWWVCHVRDARIAEIIAPALPWQRGEYLALWPPVTLILIQPVWEGAWLAAPDVPGAAPVVVHLVERGALPFEHVIGRIEGATIWYDDRDHRADPQRAEAMRQDMLAMRPKPARKVSPGERAAHDLLFLQTVAGQEQRFLREHAQRVREALATGGAEMVDLARADGELRVTWERDGQRGTAVIDPQLNVVSSGICLSGEDAKFDLTSVVGVTLDSPWYQRRRGR
jgi:hypothetical protein